MANPFASIFGPGTDAPSYEALKRKRDIAEALMQSALGTQPQNWGEGVGGLMKALGYRLMDRNLSKQEDAERQRATDQLAQIRGGMGPAGITEDQLTGLAGITSNPYAPSAVEAIAKSLMRRQLTPSEAGGFTGGGLGMPMQMSAMDMPPEFGGGMGPVDPGEIPPEEGGPMPFGEPDLPPDDQMAAAQMGTPPEPFDWQKAVADQRRNSAAFGAQPTTDTDVKQFRDWLKNTPGNRPISGAGGQLAQMPAMGPTVAEADTGTKSDASSGKNPITREQQAKYLGFWNRMDGSEPRIQEMEGVLANLAERRGDIPMIGNLIASSEFQQARRAADDWLMGLLRVDTGMTINNQELSRMDKAYIPQPGDDPPVIQDKREARERAMAGIKIGLGPAEILADELAFQREKAAKAKAPAGDAADWRNQDPSTWTDEQLQEFLK